MWFCSDWIDDGRNTLNLCESNQYHSVKPKACFPECSLWDTHFDVPLSFEWDRQSPARCHSITALRQMWLKMLCFPTKLNSERKSVRTERLPTRLYNWPRIHPGMVSLSIINPVWREWGHFVAKLQLFDQLKKNLSIYLWLTDWLFAPQRTTKNEKQGSSY